jgi:hypothetical protein
MKIYKLIYFLLFGIITSAQVKVENDSIIIWNKDRKITWDDFLSENKPALLNYQDAFASIRLAIKIYPKEINCDLIQNILVVPQMYKNLSWVGVSIETIDDDVLIHEQTHFDIAEVYARKIRKEIAAFVDSRVDCDLQAISDIYFRLEKEHWQAQFLYDHEVRECEDKLANFCHNKEKQQEWNKKVHDLLEEYKEYELHIEIDDIN